MATKQTIEAGRSITPELVAYVETLEDIKAYAQAATVIRDMQPADYDALGELCTKADQLAKTFG